MSHDGQAASDPAGHDPGAAAPGAPAQVAGALPQPEFVILTGMSGAGRSTVAKVLEDMGWFVVDNLPPQLLAPMAELAISGGGVGDQPVRVVAVVDVRTGEFFDQLSHATEGLAAQGWHPTVVFLDATDEALVRRFESVRRPHPLQAGGRLMDGITTERERLADLRAEADVVVDTSGFNIHQLAQKVRPMFAGSTGPMLRLAVMSFGFKYGVPLDADFVLDLRFLPNPFWIPELRPLTGRDAPVSEFVFSQPGAGEFVDRVAALMGPVTDGYRREGRRYATVAVGCTGGKHRSVAIAERLSGVLASPTVETFVVHRDLGRE